MDSSLTPIAWPVSDDAATVREAGRVPLPDGRSLYWESRGAAGGATVLIPGGLYYLNDLTPLAGSTRRLVAYDLRNRGESDAETSSAVRARGIAQDVEDLEAVRSALQLPTVDLIAHSYVSHIVAHYAARHPERVRRVVLLGPAPPDPRAAPSPEPPDATAVRVLADITAWRTRMPQATDRLQACREFWQIVRALYVADERHASRIDWGRCELPNERAFATYFAVYVLPSMARDPLDAARLSAVRAPVLIVHGRRDRSAPFAGAQQWRSIWPVDADLLAVDNVAHAPWIEAHTLVLAAIARFLDGQRSQPDVMPTGAEPPQKPAPQELPHRS